MNERISEQLYTKHDDEIGFFNALIIDLKLQLMGRPSREEITMERLERGTALLGKLSQCKERMRYL